MSKVQTQAEVDTKSFIAGLTDLKVSDMEAFARELNGLIYRKKSKDKTRREKELLSLINRTVLEQAKLERYLQLSVKLEVEVISEEERLEFLKLTEEEEKLRNQRVKLLIELSQLRNIPLPQLMEEMGLNPPGRG